MPAAVSKAAYFFLLGGAAGGLLGAGVAMATLLSGPGQSAGLGGGSAVAVAAGAGMAEVGSDAAPAATGSRLGGRCALRRAARTQQGAKGRRLTTANQAGMPSKKLRWRSCRITKMTAAAPACTAWREDAMRPMTAPPTEELSMVPSTERKAIVNIEGPTPEDDQKCKNCDTTDR